MMTTKALILMFTLIAVPAYAQSADEGGDDTGARSSAKSGDQAENGGTVSPGTYASALKVGSKAAPGAIAANQFLDQKVLAAAFEAAFNCQSGKTKPGQGQPAGSPTEFEQLPIGCWGELGASFAGKIEARPNHGLRHGARKATLLEDIVEVTLAKGDDNPTKKWLLGKLGQDPDFTKKLSLMALMSRAGRLTEEDTHSRPEVRANESGLSVAKFRVAAKASGLKFSEAELDDFSAGIRQDGHGGGSSDQNFLSHLLRAAHTFDLIRLNETYPGEIQGYVPGLTSQDVSRLYERAKEYISDTADSGRLATDPAALLKVMVGAHTSHGAVGSALSR